MARMLPMAAPLLTLTQLHGERNVGFWQIVARHEMGAGRMNPRHGNDLPASVGLVALAIALIVIIIVSRLTER